MQVSVEKTSELSRKMTVSLPAEMVQEKMDARFKSLAREVKLDGFRPGKVPVRVVKKMYSDKVKSEISGDLIQTTYFEALQEQKLNPAGHPHIHPVNEAEGFEYTAEFEVYPEISLDGLSSLEIKRPVAIVEQSDQDEMVLKLREQMKTWSEVERSSQSGDQVTIHFSGVCEDENFTDGTIKDFKVEIGANQMIPGFEDQLLDLNVDDKKSFELVFPEDYGNDKIAGKPGQFELEVVKIEASQLPEIDEEFIKSYGIEDGSIDGFYEDVKDNMKRELDQGLKGKLKNSVMDELYEKVQISVPTTLIDQEVENLKKPYLANAKKQNVSLEDLKMPTEMFEDQAKRRVALGLILGEIIQNNEIKVDDDKVKSTIEQMASSYESPQEMVDWYYADETRLNEIKQMVLEEQTVDWIVGQAHVTDETISFHDVMEKK